MLKATMIPPAAAVLVSAAALVTGCGADTRRSPSRPSIVLPLTAYHLNSDDNAVVAAARTVLMRECMTTKGHRWTRPPVPAGKNALLDGNARRYGLADLQAAQRFGYHVPEEPRVARAQEAMATWSGKLSKEERNSLFGPGGCEEKADSVIWKGVPRNGMWLYEMGSKAFDDSAEDPAVVSATAAWSRCMKQRNFSYRTPQEAVEDRRWNLDSPKITSAERAVATADVHCKEQTNLIAIRSGAERRIQTEMIRQNPARFKAIQKANDRFIRNARAVLNGRRT